MSSSFHLEDFFFGGGRLLGGLTGVLKVISGGTEGCSKIEGAGGSTGTICLVSSNF
jgi:hypothetical protein